MNYPSNPGVGESVIVFGLRGQYIIFAVVAVISFIIIGAILGNLDIPVLLVVLILVVSVTVTLGGIIRINKHFGRHGLMKAYMHMRLPKYVRNTIEVKKLVKRHL